MLEQLAQKPPPGKSIMPAIANPLQAVVSQIYAGWEASADNSFRPHLGASLIGHNCDRHLWYVFRWAKKPSFDGRILRLFNRGQREEAVFVAELRRIGVEVSEGPADGQQWRVSACDGHFGGSMDAVIKGLPGASQNWEVAEFKTHNLKSFRDLKTKGVELAKYQHFAQMQVYMALTGMTRANYLAVCKDSDELYYERIESNPFMKKSMIDKARRIISASEPTIGISQNIAWFECKFCDHHSICHGQDIAFPNCRTCIHSTPASAGSWACEFHKKSLTFDEQLAGCDAHRYIPKLLKNVAEFVDGDSAENWVKYKSKSGSDFSNSNFSDGLSSIEIFSGGVK